MKLSHVVFPLLFCAAVTAHAADDPAPKTAQPSSTVSNDSSKTAANTDAAKTPPAKEKSSKPKSDDDKDDGDFKPSEQVSEDMAVAYPTDI